MDDNETVVLYNSRARYIRLLIVCILFVACGVWMVQTDSSSQSQFYGWLNIIFFGLGVIVAVRQIFDKKPRIVIDSHGITDKTLKVGLIEWQDIETASLIRIQRQHFIALELESEKKYLDRLSTVHKRAADANLLLGFQRLNINLSGVKCDENAILNIVRQESGYARNPNPNR